MTHTHTLGPWRVSGPRLTSLTAQPVHDVFIGTSEDSAIVEGPNARANAALISAAPDMLAALQDIANRGWNVRMLGANGSLYRATAKQIANSQIVKG